MSFDFVSAKLAIKAMRSNGFKSTDYAISELIDNSIQAAFEAGSQQCNVELVCLEERIERNGRRVSRISEIIIADSSGGMPADILRSALMFGSGTNLDVSRQKGIGKFGMGLPNASISQCKLMEVYSWQNKICHMTSLDVSAIENGDITEVPAPIRADLPPHFKNITSVTSSDGGTIVVWKNLDKTTWVQHKAFFANSEFLVGRMYRNFINSGQVKIRFSAFERLGENQFTKLQTLDVRANDPLMLMSGTSAPTPYNSDPAFQEHGQPYTMRIQLNNGVESELKIRFSVATAEARQQKNNVAAGNMEHGRYCARNQGVSIVRAGRELELNTSWVTPGDLRERWWGVEISFEPELDELFGVTNNKQAATKLFRANIQEDAKNLGIKQSDFLQQLYEEDDPRVPVYEISKVIESRLNSLREVIKKQNAGDKAGRNNKAAEAERRATIATQNRINDGMKTDADKLREESTEEERKEAIKQEYLNIGANPEIAERIALEKISENIRFNFVDSSLSSAAIFDVSQEKGEYFIKLNSRHPAHEQFIGLLETSEDEDSKELEGLKMLLSAWTRMEDEADGKMRENIEDIRLNWGRYARDYMSNDG